MENKEQLVLNKIAFYENAINSAKLLKEIISNNNGKFYSCRIENQIKAIPLKTGYLHARYISSYGYEKKLEIEYVDKNQPALYIVCKYSKDVFTGNKKINAEAINTYIDNTIKGIKQRLDALKETLPKINSIIKKYEIKAKELEEIARKIPLDIVEIYKRDFYKISTYGLG